jgi:hypothetical protein
LHAKAIVDLDRVAKRAIVLCEPVLTEACLLLSHPVQRARLERLVVEIGMMPLAVEDLAGLRRQVFAWRGRLRATEGGAGLDLRPRVSHYVEASRRYADTSRGSVDAGSLETSCVSSRT